MVIQVKRCPECKKRFTWNPDVGKFRCPYCFGLGKTKKEGLLSKIKKHIKKIFT